jgi:hypothetical protein
MHYETVMSTALMNVLFFSWISSIFSRRRRISAAILTMKQSGELASYQNKWDGKGGNCVDPEGSNLPVRRSDSSVTFMALGPRDLAVPFLLLFLCLLITAGVAGLEIAYTQGYFEVSGVCPQRGV